MLKLTPEGERIVAGLAERYRIGTDAVKAMLDAVNRGGGTMAQFNVSELGGGGQWMRGGMTMVGDMFNNSLKATVDNLCSELSDLIANQPNFFAPPVSQSQQQSQGGGWQSQGSGLSQHSGLSQGGGLSQGSGLSQHSGLSQGSGRPGEGVSLFVPQSSFQGWWPPELGSPSSTGSQNSLRYAYFPGSNRLAIDASGRVEVYDTTGYDIYGFGQQQSGDASITFSSQRGVVRVDGLPRISGQPAAVSAPAPEMPGSSAPAGGDHGSILSLLEQLGALKDKGILTEEEFAAKKAELLKRF